MKLKFALLSDGQDSRDLVATIDASTTVGDLATYLVNADPCRPSPEGPVDSFDDGPRAVGAGGAGVHWLPGVHRVRLVQGVMASSPGVKASSPWRWLTRTTGWSTRN